VWLAAEFAPRLHVPIPAIATVTLLVLASYAYVSYRQVGYWRNSYTLFSHAVAVTSHNAIAEDNLGATLIAMGRPDLGQSHIEAAIRYMPRLSTAHYNYGYLLHTQGHLEQAAAEYRIALLYVSDPEEAARDHNNLGSALNRLGQPDAALQEYSAAIKINPDEQNSYLGRGTIEFSEKDFAAARNDFQSAAQIAPSWLADFWLGRIMEEQGDVAGAKQEYAAALALNPNATQASQKLSALQTSVTKHD
jgi:protein O-mannosyl-transferase